MFTIDLSFILTIIATNSNVSAIRNIGIDRQSLCCTRRSFRNLLFFLKIKFSSLFLFPQYRFRIRKRKAKNKNPCVISNRKKLSAISGVSLYYQKSMDRWQKLRNPGNCMSFALQIRRTILQLILASNPSEICVAEALFNDFSCLLFSWTLRMALWK